MSKTATPPDAPAERTIGGLKVQKVETMTEPNSILIYGNPKVGKSTLAAGISEVPGYEKTLFIDIDRGTTAFSSTYPNVDVVQPDKGDVNAVIEVINAIRDDPDGLGYRAVVIDTFSVLADWAIATIAGGKKPEWDDWGQLKEWATELAWDMHYMKPLAIMLFHTQTKENKLTGERTTGPKMSGSAATLVAAVPDLIGYLAVTDRGRDSIDRTLRCYPGEQLIAGSRFPGIPEQKLGDANMPALFSFIRGEGEWQTAPASLLERFAATDEGEVTDTDDD